MYGTGVNWLQKIQFIDLDSEVHNPPWIGGKNNLVLIKNMIKISNPMDIIDMALNLGLSPKLNYDSLALSNNWITLSTKRISSKPTNENKKSGTVSYVERT